MHNTELPGCSGFCRTCGGLHSLPAHPAAEACMSLMRQLDQSSTILIDSPDSGLCSSAVYADFSTDYLYGKGGGQMFGILVCETPDGGTVELKAFSGQYNGHWHADGWVGPVLLQEDFDRLTAGTDPLIKEAGRKIAVLPEDSEERKNLFLQRREMSRNLMNAIHSLYVIRNFKGEVTTLEDLFCGRGGIPAGTGDCCAPKLLNHAALNGLKPVSLTEFFYGREPASGKRRHGRFYPACTDKCGPLLGFMLCGATS